LLSGKKTSIPVLFCPSLWPRCATRGDDSDYADDGDDDDNISAGFFVEAGHLNEAAPAQEIGLSSTVCKHSALLKQERHQQETAVINFINPHQCHQMHTDLPSVEVQDTHPYEAGNTPHSEQHDSSLQKKSCPHHPYARMVRFDPAGQAWCDRLDCWDCYQLMKIGEMLGYCCVIDRGGQLLIDQGMETWSAFVRSQRPFTVMVATKEVIALCKTQGVEVPDLSSEVEHLTEMHLAPP
jgi:hypothetical protein